MVAADWKVLPQGTKIIIEGYGEVVVEDKGGAIRNNKIDIFMETEEACKKWGVRKVKVKILN